MSGEWTTPDPTEFWPAGYKPSKKATPAPAPAPAPVVEWTTPGPPRAQVAPATAHAPARGGEAGWDAVVKVLLDRISALEAGETRHRELGESVVRLEREKEALAEEAGSIRVRHEEELRGLRGQNAALLASLRGWEGLSRRLLADLEAENRRHGAELVAITRMFAESEASKAALEQRVEELELERELDEAHWEAVEATDSQSGHGQSLAGPELKELSR